MRGRPAGPRPVGCLSKYKRFRAFADIVEWASYQIATEDASSNNRTWAYWRQVGFLFGTMVLAVGPLFVTPTTEGPERWICLVMLTVILYSVYASNSVWG